MRIRPLPWSFALALGALGFGAAATPAHADVLFSTFGPGQSFDTSGGGALPVLNTPVGPFNVGSTFTPTETAAVSQIDAANSGLSDFGNGNFLVQLWSSFSFGSTTVPQSKIDSFSVTAGALPGVLTILTPDHPVLAAGQTYYLVEQPTGGNGVVWYANNQGLMGRIFATQFGPAYFQTSTLPAFDVVGPQCPSLRSGS
jgi:hypothetical protein